MGSWLDGAWNQALGCHRIQRAIRRCEALNRTHNRVTQLDPIAKALRMQGASSRDSNPCRLSNDADNVPVSRGSDAPAHVRVQVQPARTPVTENGATRPKSMATRVIQVLTAATFRARLEVRHAFKTADRALSDVIKSVRAGDEKAIKAASEKFTVALSPLVRLSEKCPTEVELRGTCLARKIANNGEFFLASLSDHLGALSDTALMDPVVGHLDFVVNAAILNKRAQAFEEQGRVFDGRGLLDLTESSAADLNELIHMGQVAHALDEAAPREQHLRDEVPGTQLTPARLKSMAAFGKEAARELAKRETLYTGWASNDFAEARKFAEIKGQTSDKLKAQSEKLADFIESLKAEDPLRTKFLGLHETITKQIQVLEDRITVRLIGPIEKFDASKLDDQQLIALRKAILATPNAPAALVNAGNNIKAEIAHRNELAKLKSSTPAEKGTKNPMPVAVTASRKKPQPSAALITPLVKRRGRAV